MRHVKQANNCLKDRVTILLLQSKRIKICQQSSLYNFISDQKLNLSELPRDKISGQASGEIRPKRLFPSRPRTQVTDNATQSPDNKKDEKTAPKLETKEESNSKGNIGNCSSEELENITNDANILMNEIIETSSPDEILKAMEDVSVSEDSTSFLSELHGPDGSNFVGANETSEAELVLEASDILDGSERTDNEPFFEKPFYDPSGWTPMEIEAATGNSECTTMEYPLRLRSTYSEVEDYSGTRDSNGEPQVTSYHRNFQGTVDYIWRSEGLQTVRVLAPIPKQAMLWTPGFPTKRWGSDHVALVAELAFNKDLDDKKSEMGFNKQVDDEKSEMDFNKDLDDEKSEMAFNKDVDDEKSQVL